MDKKGLIDKTTQLLAAKDARKPIPALKDTIYFSDKGGHKQTFSISKPQTALLFTRQDVGQIVDALLDVITDAVREGEEVSIYGFGSLTVQRRAARSVLHPATGERTPVSERFVPKLNAMGVLRRAAKLYGMHLREQEEAMRNGD